MMAKGFTLLEILVSMTLFSAIAGLLMSSFLNFQGIGQRLDNKMKLRQELRNLETLIREDIYNVVYLDHFANTGAGTSRPSGMRSQDQQEGTLQRDRLDLQVHSRGKFFTGFKRAYNPELFEVSYYFSQNHQGETGFYRRESYFIDGPIEEGGEEIVHRLSTHVKVFNLTFYDQDNKTLPKWTSTKTANLPAGVEVDLTIQNKQGEEMTQRFTINLHPSMGANVSWGHR